jgi:hypothetical protein
MIKRVAAVAVVGMALAPMTAQATTICAPSDPAGYYGCASMSVSYDAVLGVLSVSVQNLDAYDNLAMTGTAYGWRIWGVGLIGDPSLASYFTGSVETTLGTGANWVGPGSQAQWDFTTNLQGIWVDAGALDEGVPGSIQGCVATGSQNNYYDTCNGAVVFKFGMQNLSQADFDATDISFALRGGAGPDDVSFKSGTPVPEPMSMLLVGTGLLGVGAVLRRRRDDQLEE